MDLPVPTSPPRLPGFATPVQQQADPPLIGLSGDEFPAGSTANTVSYDPVAHWQRLRQKATAEGETAVAAALVCPVIVQNQGPSEWQPLQWDLVKELRKTIIKHGLTLPFAQSLLQNVMRGHLLTPFDVRSLADLIFTPSQKLLWQAYWRDLCNAASLDNLGRQPGDLLVGVGIAELMGEAPIATPQLQARLAPEILRQSADLAFQAMLKVPDTRKAVKSSTSIKQDATEPYMQFIDRLQEAIQKQVEHLEAEEALMFKSAVENASEDCKKLLQLLRNPTHVEMIETGNRVGSLTYAILAAALVAALRADNRACFHCGKPSHSKRSCPQRDNQVSQTTQIADLNLPGFCPRC